MEYHGIRDDYVFEERTVVVRPSKKRPSMFATRWWKAEGLFFKGVRFAERDLKFLSPIEVLETDTRR